MCEVHKTPEEIEANRKSCEQAAVAGAAPWLDRLEQYMTEWRPLINQGAPTGFGPENLRSYDSQTYILARDLVRMFCDEVNRRAEVKMLMTSKLEGSHYASMTEFSRELRGALDQRSNGPS